MRLNRLTARKVATAIKPGLIADGGGLWLRVGRSGSKSWAFRYMLNGKAREMGLGGLAKVGLADARKKAAPLRLLLADKVDPLEHRKLEKSANTIAAAQSMTFDECAASYIKAHEVGWRHSKHRLQWSSSLARYVSPAFGAVSVSSINVGTVMAVLEPLWTKTPETASRVRGRIERILDWARVRGFREGENPARWRGHLDHLLPAPTKVRKVKHYRALPYTDIAAFVAELRSRGGVGASALEFLILCAARSSEVAGVRWTEIDRGARMWIVPPERMKGGRGHRVPLSSAAMAVLDRMKAAGGEFVFSNEPGRGLGKGALAKQIKGRNCTVHGFRAAFKTWASERTNFPRELVEAALAHVLDDKTEEAYLRGDMLEKRRRLMTAWAEFCAKPASAATVIPLRTA
jgi:integrase